MSRPANCVHVVYSGIVGSEIFAVGHWLGSATAANQATADFLSNELKNLFQSNVLSSAKALVGSDTVFQKVTTYEYSGGVNTAAWQSTAAIASGTGTSVGSSLPLQTSLVVSLRTATPGRSGRGRMYFPCTAFNLSSHLVVNSGVLALANAVAAYFSAINASATIPNAVAAVVSDARSSIYPITSVLVDDKPDTQRRRANRLVAANRNTAVVTA